MRVLLTGANGQLGQAVARRWSDDKIFSFTREELDITDEHAVTTVATEIAPDVIVNAAAFTAVDRCETEPDLAHRVNALGPWWLARAARLVDAELVHVSTDYVFSGAMQQRGLTEFDPTVPATEYGRSKLAGERLVRDTWTRHHIVRTAWVYGAGGNNFVNTMLRLGRERGEVTVVADQYGCPTLTDDLADALREIAVSGRHGTWHRTGTGHTTWFDFARTIFEFADMDVTLTPCTTEQFALPAPRPAWSVLSNAHAEAAGLSPMRSWADALQDHLQASA